MQHCGCPLAPTILGQYITVSTRNSKVLNRPLSSNLLLNFTEFVSKLNYQTGPILNGSLH